MRPELIPQTERSKELHRLKIIESDVIEAGKILTRIASRLTDQPALYPQAWNMCELHADFHSRYIKRMRELHA